MASGSTYPGSLDSYVDKIAGDFLTIADVNNRSSAIEKLEAGPLRLNDGSAATPAYAFRSAATSGMYYSSATPSINFSIGGTTAAAIVKAASAVNFVTLLSTATGVGVSVLPNGTDTNVALVLDTKGTGQLVFAVGGSTKLRLDSSGRFLVGHNVVTSAGAGDIVLASQHSLRSVNNAGTDTVQILGVDNTDRLLLGGAGVTEIVWGRAVIPMGGGSTATLGTIGGSGPITAGQNTWMKVYDSALNAMWIPAWR